MYKNFFYLCLLILIGCSNKKDTSIHLQNAFFVGRDKCLPCHEKEDKLFRGSDHDLAMAHATETSVLGDFNNSTFTHFGITSKFYKKDSTFYVFTEDEKGKFKEFEIKYTFGVRPLQQYLIEFPGGHIQCLPIAWDSRSKDEGGQKWFHLYPNERIAPGDILYWTRITQNWNYMCAECHSTNLKKNYDMGSKTYNTTWFEINVSCEACHGPGSEHVRWANIVKDSLYNASDDMGLVVEFDDLKNSSWKINPETGNPTLVGTRNSTLVEMCARCHSRRSAITEDYQYGKPLSESHLISLLDENLYYPDGQIKDEVYVYGSFLQSKMHQSGVICSDCHDSHSARVREQGNALCYRCHLFDKYDNRDHHFHKKESASCMDCHMPETTYMVNDPRRDHSFLIPRPDLSHKLDTPNVCTQCHKDKSIPWAANYFKQWYPERVKEESFAEIFIAARKGDPKVFKKLTTLILDKNRAAIVRASALAMLNNYPAYLYQNLFPEFLKDSQTLVRRAAVELLANAPLEMRRSLLFPLIDDPSRVVRIMAANNLSRMDKDVLGKAYQELIESQIVNADHPASLLNLSALYLDAQEYLAAETVLNDAIEIEPLYIPAYINMADFYRLNGQDEIGKKVLTKALKIAPQNASLHYAIGLTFVRLKEKEKALKHIKIAADTDPQNKIHNYAYAVSIASHGNTEQAINKLENLLKIHPNDFDILQALISYNKELGNEKETTKYNKKLKALSSPN